jgi:hypothetical protein
MSLTEYGTDYGALTSTPQVDLAPQNSIRKLEDLDEGNRLLSCMDNSYSNSSTGGHGLLWHCTMTVEPILPVHEVWPKMNPTSEKGSRKL